jgi:hypothetical protein
VKFHTDVPFETSLYFYYSTGNNTLERTQLDTVFQKLIKTMKDKISKGEIKQYKREESSLIQHSAIAVAFNQYNSKYPDVQCILPLLQNDGNQKASYIVYYVNPTLDAASKKSMEDMLEDKFKTWTPS